MDRDDFDIWHEKKKYLHLKGKRPPYFSKGEIWWAHLGKNVSSEIAGKGRDFIRPILILQRVFGNACMAVPLTSKLKKGNYYFTFFDVKNNSQSALLTQIRYLDAKRLKYKFSKVSESVIKNVCNRLMSILVK